MCDAKTNQRIARMEKALSRMMDMMWSGGGNQWGGSRPQNGGMNPSGGSTGFDPSANPCGGQQKYCPPSLVSPETEAAIKAQSRTSTLQPAIASLGAGATSAAATVASNGLPRTIVISDLVSTVTNLDNLRVIVSVGGVEKFQFNGGKFSRGNANACVTACGYGVCLGPIESFVVTVKNQGGALAATDSMTLDLTSIYPGEPGYMCGPCVEPDGTVREG